MLSWDDDNHEKSTAILSARIYGKTVVVDWHGMPLVCLYEYTPGEPATMTDPEEPDHFELVEAIAPDGFDLLNHGCLYQDISNLAILTLKGEADGY